ncbi:hypothetical protein [Glycomyces tritici]|uniref:DUF2269 domain-containing protein n=1 Tax=Glycomyces tritici TaxID=2665176 RepID=A0ABT7YTR8_9ACTN|nr:hypothetical protein [Glycomyces tritici]MDN3242035.1 hypothetical protein [Glycomyces tritici]
MLPHNALDAQGMNRPRGPEPVRIAFLVLAALIPIDLIAGLIGGFALFAANVANDMGGRTVVVPAYTKVVLAVALGFAVVWTIGRVVLAFGVAKGRPLARIAAIAAAGLAIAVWAAATVARLEDGDGVDIGGGPMEALRGFAIACIIESAAIIVLLCLPSARAWFKRDQVAA